jgi:voltage-gated potassium channel
METARLRTQLRLLYFGPSTGSRNFRFILVAADVLLLAYFIATTFMREAPPIRGADLAIAAFIAADFAIRLWLHERKLRYFQRLSTWGDIAVIVALLVPALVENLLFLRVLRLLRLLRVYHALDDLRDLSNGFRRHEEVIDAVINLIVFIFVMSAVVFVLQVSHNPGINNYVDALYFTVSALTTTGFGDIVMYDPAGKLLAVAIMVFGVALFIRLVRFIFRPEKRRSDCPQCGLDEHDFDAAHCKRCGHEITINSSHAEEQQAAVAGRAPTPGSPTLSPRS